MHSFTLLSILSFSSIALAAPDLARRSHHRGLLERQGQGRPNMNNSWSEPPISSSTSIISTSTSDIASSTQSSSAAVQSSSTSVTQSSAVVPSSSSSSQSSAISTSSAVQETLTSTVTLSTSDVQTSAAASTQPSPTAVVPTISVPSSAAALPSTILTSSVTRTLSTSVTTATRTASSSASAVSSAAADSETKTTGGLSKPALIAIIAVSSVVGIAAIAFTLFRKYKLRPSKRFEKRLNAIDFTPKGGHGDDFYEKSHNRSASASSAERHRKALVAEEFDSAPGLTDGIPEHDFTAGTAYGLAGAGAGAAAAGYAAQQYNSDPFAHTQSYDYGSYGASEPEHGYPPVTYDQYGNPAASYDYPTQDESAAQGQGYADLQRGNSNGSAHQYSHTTRVVSPTMSNNAHVVSPNLGSGIIGGQMYQDDFPESGQFLGRPTGGADGPYAQAAQYRAY